MTGLPENLEKPEEPEEPVDPKERTFPEDPSLPDEYEVAEVDPEEPIAGPVAGPLEDDDEPYAHPEDPEQ